MGRETLNGDHMEDFLVLAVGRAFIELAASREQLHQALQQKQKEAEAGKPKPEVEGD